MEIQTNKFIFHQLQRKAGKIYSSILSMHALLYRNRGSPAVTFDYDIMYYRQHPAFRNVGIKRYFEKFHRVFFMDRPTEKKLYHVIKKVHSILLTLIKYFSYRLSLNICF